MFENFRFELSQIAKPASAIEEIEEEVKQLNICEQPAAEASHSQA